MSVAELLEALRRRSIHLRADGDRLKVSAPAGAVTEELSAGIRAYKAELLRLLAETRLISVEDPSQRRIERAPDQQRYALSFAQRRAAAVHAATAMLPSAFRLTGPLDVGSLHETLRRIAARHAPMRSRFELEGAEPQQVVEPSIDVELPATDLAHLPEAERVAALQRLLVEQARTPLDLHGGRPFRYHVFRETPSRHVLFAGFSPLIFDGWCFDVFWNELRQGYAAIRAGRPWPVVPLPISYADHVLDQQRRIAREGEQLAAFWRRTLGDELPPVPLPTDFARPAVAASRGEGIPFELGAATVRMLAAASRAHGMTPQMLMLGALFVWAARLSGQDENVIATPVDARLHSATEGLIGPFANIVLLRFRVDVAGTFAAMLPALRAFCLEAYQHQEHPLERVDVEARRRPGERFSPAFQLEFSYQMVHGRGPEMGDVTLSQVELESGAAANDLTLWVKDWGTRIGGAVEFRPELFERATVAHWIECYKVLLDALLREPGRPMAELDLLGAEAAAVAAVRGDAAAVVDPRGMPLPLGIPGRLAGGTGDARYRLRYDGRLERCATEPWRRPEVAVADDGLPSAIETRIAQFFGSLTGAGRVGPQQSFFDLGGTSIKAVRLFAWVHEAFGVRMPLTTIVSADTPRKLAAAITRGFQGRNGSLVELRPGNGPQCLFLIHDADGESLLYLELARRLPRSLGVYGLEPASRGPLPVVHTSIEEFASAYVSEIRRRQPRGPYVLGGLCAGGLFAFETARQLRAAGEEVALLVLLECGTPRAPKRCSRLGSRTGRLLGLLRARHEGGLLARLRALGAKAGGFVQFVSGRRRARADVRRQLELLLRCRDGAPWPPGDTPPTMREVWSVIETGYRPEPAAAFDAVLYRAAAGQGSDLPYREFLSDPLFGWSAVLGSRLTAIDVPGGHFSCLREPNVAALAADLTARLARVFAPRATGA